MSPIRPLFDRIIVERNEADDKVGRFFIPENAKVKATQGTVLATGPGRITKAGDFAPLNVQVGDHIVFNKYAGTEVVVAGKTQLLLRETDVFGILED